KLNLSLVTINKIVDELVSSGEILDMGQTDSTGGRKARLYTLNKNHKSMLTVLLRNDIVSLAILNLIGEICYEITFPYNSDWINKLTEYINIEDLPPVACIGVAVPGTVHGGIIKNIPAMPSLEELHLEEILTRELKLPVLIENDINTAALGIHRTDGNDTNNMILIYVDIAIGMGIIINRQIYQSIRNFAGELAYMRLGDEKNIEQYVMQCINNGEITKALAVLSKIIANVCCVIDPDMIVIDSPVLKQECLNILQKGIIDIIGQDFLPKMELSYFTEEVYYQGLYFLYMEKENFYKKR
ncbi:MAG: ROK family protein, partial [Defluviitaleaceae bacterium]|nr:ROK family protein [Defluviitaleaceae bacterium]